MKKLFTTENTCAPLIARITVGLVILPHGLQKLLGMFGGYGFDGTMGFLTGTVGLPWIVAFMVIMIESLGAVSLIVGFLSRIWASLMIVLMIGAVWTAHISNGFFMNWSGSQKGEGYEYHILVIGLSLIVAIAGAGKASIDRILAK